jgi:hypothetical protein
MINALIGTYAPVGKNALFSVKISDGEDNVHERVVPLSTKNSYAAQLYAVKYVCEAVENKDSDLKITTSMAYIINALTKDGGKRSGNAELIEEIKTLLKQFKSTEFVLDVDHNTDDVKSRAKKYSSI